MLAPDSRLEITNLLLPFQATTTVHTGSKAKCEAVGGMAAAAHIATMAAIATAVASKL